MLAMRTPPGGGRGAEDVSRQRPPCATNVTATFASDALVESERSCYEGRASSGSCTAEQREDGTPGSHLATQVAHARSDSSHDLGGACVRGEGARLLGSVSGASTPRQRIGSGSHADQRSAPLDLATSQALRSRPPGGRKRPHGVQLHKGRRARACSTQTSRHGCARSSPRCAARALRGDCCVEAASAHAGTAICSGPAAHLAGCTPYQAAA